MLYEVITDASIRRKLILTANRMIADAHDDTREGNEIIEESANGSRYAASGLPGVTMMVSPACRITSYNVCYTKLLRVQQEEQGGA